MAQFKFIKLAQVTAAELYDSTVQYLTTTYNQSKKVFSLASGYGQIIQVLQELQQLNLYYIEDSVNELNFLTATRSHSIYGLTTINGHKPTRAISSQGQLEISWNGADSDIINGSIIIPNLMNLNCATNNLNYVLQINSDSIYIQLDQTKKYLCNIIQGKYEIQEFQSDGTKLQSYYAQIGPTDNIDNYLVKVYVNSEEWTIFDEFYDIPYNYKGCYVKTGVLPGLDIFFGNGDFGLVPANGSLIRIEYVKTNGAAGDLNSNVDHVWTFTETGYDQFANEIDLNSVLTVKTKIAPLLGSDGEDLALTKLIGNRNSKNYVLVGPDNYIIFFEKFNIFSIVRAWVDTNLDNNIIYLMLVPDISKRLLTGETYFTVPYSKLILTKDENARILNLLDETGSKIIGTSNQLVDINILRYIVNINLKIFEGYETNDAIPLKNQIVNAISNYMLSFTRRDALPKSDFTNIIEDIPGVDSVSINFISENNEIFKTNPLNTSLPDKEIDNFGDIVFNDGDLPVIRGGWKDRYGVYYQDGIDFTKPSTININVASVTKLDYLAQKSNTNNS